MNAYDLRERTLGSLAAACIGDALGAPTEERSIAEIRRLWGGRVEVFYTPPDYSPFARGRAAGQITDDASQLLYLMDAYIEGQGVLTLAGVARALLAWAGSEYYRFAGPSTRAAIERLRAGEDPAASGLVGRLTSEGTTNGAAMRVAPAGLAHPGNPEAAVRDAVLTALPTHGTNHAIAGAACVAAAVAEAASEESTVRRVIAAARWGAAMGEELGLERGRDAGGPTVSRRLELALELAEKASSLDEAVSEIAETVGTGLPMSEAVPAALGIFLAAGGDPFLSVVGGANAGSDTDTVACIAGSIAGAFRGFAAIPTDLYQQVLAANHLDLEDTARRFALAVLSREHVA